MKKNIILPAVVIGLLTASCGGSGQPESEREVAVKTVKVSSELSLEGVAYSGTIEEMTGTALSFGSAGTIATMNVREGMTVAKGQVLATLDGKTQANMLASAHSATVIAQQELSRAEDTYGRMKTLHDAGSLAEMKWIEVETSLAQAKAAVEAARAQEAIAAKGSADTNLTAPFAGFVATKMADIGQQVVPGTPVVKLVDIDRVKAKFSVGETEVGSLSVGQTMAVRIATLGGAVFEGRISDKSVSADPISRSYDVSVLIDNSGHRILPGMLCEAAATSATGEKTIAVPSQVVLIDETNRRYVWCVSGGKATKKYVTLGRNAGDKVVVTDGLADGDEVITDGRQKVWEGATCKTE
ncbi:MAG: efflux RND transporter periplasmic adaptor subunit [Prevotella sp.]|nr:efflux RND transporter periplasmic adaptor subunit [Prevotella sp.]